MIKILIYLGTSRQNNYSQYVANFINQTVADHPALSAQLLTAKNLDLNFNDEGQTASSTELLNKVKQADTFILVSPEYNHGYPGTLKYMLDLNLEAYMHKPVALVGVSAGPFGGTRVIEQLVQVVRELGMVVTSTDLNVSNVKQEIRKGKFINSQTWVKRANKMLDELAWMAQVLQDGRQKYPTDQSQ